MKRKRIVIVTSSYPPKTGGIAASHYNIYRLLKDHYDVKVIAFDDADRGTDEDVTRATCPWLIEKVIRLGMSIYLRKYGVGALCPWATKIQLVAATFRWKLNAVIKRFHPDFILVPDNNVPAYGLWKPPGCKLVWFCRNNNARFRNHRLLTYLNWLDVELATSMERRALRKADMVVCPSQYMVHEFARSFVVDAPVSLINNFMFRDELTAIDAMPIHDELGIDRETPVVYIPSAGTINKGTRYVFEIVRRISKQLNYRVAFYLSGHIPPDLACELESMGDRVKIYAPGHVTRAENLPIVKSCQICVSPTLIENYSNALVESICMGIPCVTFDTGGNREIVDHDENGFIVEYLDIDDLTDKAVVLLGNTRLYRSFSESALAKGRCLTETDKVLNLYHLLFSQLSGNALSPTDRDRPIDLTSVLTE